MNDVYYRYLSHPDEIQQILKERKVLTTNPSAGHATWYTPTRYEDLVLASEELALPSAPTHRVGPVPADEMPGFHVSPRTVAPAFGKPGGGVEACIRRPVWLLGLWNDVGRRWDL